MVPVSVGRTLCQDVRHFVGGSMSVITVDFADRALRKKIQGLLNQADAKMLEYTLYCEVHKGAPIGSNERALGLVMYKQYQELSGEAIELSGLVKGDYKFVSKNIVISRNGHAVTGKNGDLTFKVNGVMSIDLTNETPL